MAKFDTLLWADHPDGVLSDDVSASKSMKADLTGRAGTCLALPTVACDIIEVLPSCACGGAS